MLSTAKRIFLVLGIFLLGFSVLLLILQNPQRAQFHFLQWTTPELPFSILLVIAFAMGAFAALVFSIWLLARRDLRLSLRD